MDKFGRVFALTFITHDCLPSLSFGGQERFPWCIRYRKRMNKEVETNRKNYLY